MKIVSLMQYGNYDMQYGSIYVGNEFSPDPSDMIQKIRSAYPISTAHGTEVTVQAKVNTIQDEEDIVKMLARNGYVLYNPHTVLLVDDINA